MSVVTIRIWYYACGLWNKHFQVPSITARLFPQCISQLLLRIQLAVYQTDLLRPVPHAGDELDQPCLVGMGRVAAESSDTGVNIKTLALQLHIPALWPVFLDGPAWRSLGLEAGKDDVMPGVAQHGFEIVDHPPCTAHAVAGDDYGRLPGLGQSVDHGQVLTVGIDRKQLLEPQRFVPCRHPPQRFLIPVRLQLSVQLSKACGQRGIQDDRHLQPITSLATDDRFQFIQKFLCATDAEGRDKYSTTVR